MRRSLLAVLITLFLLPSSVLAYRSGALDRIARVLDDFLSPVVDAQYTSPPTPTAFATAQPVEPATAVVEAAPQQIPAANTAPVSAEFFAQLPMGTDPNASPLPSDDLVHTSVLAAALAAFESKIDAQISTITKPPAFPQEVAAGGNGIFSYGAAAAASSYVPSAAATTPTTFSALSGSLNLGSQVSGTLATANGGTGLTSAPAYGQLLLGQSNGTYALVATSSLGIGGSGTVSSGTQGQFAFYNAGGTTVTATSSLFLAQNGNIGIGTTTPAAALSVAGDIIAQGPIVDVRAYGAVGDGVHDDTAAINAALALGNHTVLLPAGTFKISSPLIIKSGDILDGVSRTGTVIAPLTQTFPAISASGLVVSWKVTNLSITFTNSYPGNGGISTSANARGISVTNSGGQYPYFFGHKDVEVIGAYDGFYAQDLSFMFSIEDFFSGSTGHYGIDMPYTSGGTTVTIKNAYSQGGNGLLNIIGVVELAIINSASDHATALNNYIRSCTGSIIGFDAESNTIPTGGAILTIDAGNMTVSGYTTYQNTFAAGAGQESYGIRGEDGAQVTVSASHSSSDTNSGAGVAYEVLGDPTGSFVVTGSNFTIPSNTGGGSSYGIYTYNNAITQWNSTTPIFASTFTAASTTLTNFSANSIPYFTTGGSMAQSTNFVFTGSYLGLGTTSPWGRLSITGAGTGSEAGFVFADSTNAPQFVIQDNGNVGVGTTGPNRKLVVSGNGTFDNLTTGATQLRLSHVDSGVSAGLLADDGVGTEIFSLTRQANNTASLSAYGDVGLASGATGGPSTNYGLILKSGGNVGIATTSPDMLLTVGSNSPSGNVAHFENSTGSCYINPTTTSLSCSSDRRLKTNIVPLESADGLEALLKLNPVTYNWKTEAATTSPHTGFIAQDVQPVLPDLVSQGPDGYYTLNYAGLTPYLVKAVQEIATLSDTFKTNLIAWLGSASNGIHDLFAAVGHFDETRTQKLCTTRSDGTPVCVTNDQLAGLLSQAARLQAFQYP